MIFCRMYKMRHSNDYASVRGELFLTGLNTRFSFFEGLNHASFFFAASRLVLSECPGR
jgi:hypothetical protein